MVGMLLSYIYVSIVYLCLPACLNEITRELLSFTLYKIEVALKSPLVIVSDRPLLPKHS